MESKGNYQVEFLTPDNRWIVYLITEDLDAAQISAHYILEALMLDFQSVRITCVAPGYVESFNLDEYED